MAESRPADILRDKYVRRMGDDLGQLYYELYNEVAWLWLKWRQYRALFGQDEVSISPLNRTSLLNSTAPLFFALLQATLFEDLLLHLARLTDPPRSMGRDNLSVRRLPELIGDVTLKSSVDRALNQVLARCEFAREWRNRRLAHADLLTKRVQHPKPLPPADRRSVENALRALHELLNELEGHYCGAKVAYVDVEWNRDPGGADNLLRYSTMGLEAEAAERRRLRGQ